MGKILEGIIIGVIVATVGWMISTFFSAPAPVLYLNPSLFPSERCFPNSMDFSHGYTYEFKLSNKAETKAISKVCLYGDNVTFEVGGVKQNNSICYEESLVHPKSSDLFNTYDPKIYANGADNITLKINVSCNFKVFGINRSCNSLAVTCNFKKGTNNHYQRI